MKPIIGRIMLATLLSAAWTAIVHAQGTAFTYQGQLNDDGSPANGSYDLQFTLWNAASGPSQIGGAVTVNDLAISNGLFTATLDFGAGAFAGSARWLEIAVRPGASSGAYTNLLPRTQILPSAHAIYAGTAGSVPNGAIGSAEIANNSVASTDIANGTVTLSDFNLTSVDGRYVLKAGDTMSGPLKTPALTVPSPGVITANNLYSANGILGIRSDSDIEFVIDRNNNPSLGAAFELFNGAGGHALVVGETGNGRFFGDLTVDNNLEVYGLQRLYQGDGQVGIYLNGNSGGAGVAYLYQADGQTGIYLDGDSGGGGLQYLYAADGSIGISLDGESGGGGYLTVRNTNGLTRVSADGQSLNGGGEVSVYDASGTETVEIVGQKSSTLGAQISLKQDSGIVGILMEAEYGASGEGGAISLNNSSGNVGLRLEGDQNNAGYATFYNADGGTRIVLNGDSGGAGYGTFYTADGSIGIVLDGDSGGAGYVSIRNTNSGSRVVLDGQYSYGGGQVNVYSSSGSARVQLWGEDSNGDGKVVCDVLQINGGSDLSEQFDVSAMDQTIHPGAVVCIDPDHPGKLKVSHQAYDRTVAGVVSGAGGVKTGMLMGQNGTLADGQHPIALTGRVYCLVDADQGAILPGDLITTSSTPGYGMRVADHARAQGAILGKAMSSLASGRGLVLVLVSLQ